MRTLVKKSTIGKKRVAETKKRAVTVSSRDTFVSTNTIAHTLEKRNGDANICIIRSLGGIGDVIMCLPTLYHLKQKYPKAKLTFAIDMHSTKNYVDMLKGTTYIDHLVDARHIDKRQYHNIMDITSVCVKYEHSGQKPRNRIDIFAKACGFDSLMSYRPLLKVEDGERVWARNYLQQSSQGKKVVVLHTASFEDKRSWPPHKYIELVDLAVKEQLNCKFLLLDFNNKTPALHNHPMIINASRSRIREMMALIEEAHYFIGPDSGPMHIAGALGTKSLVLFGSIPPSCRINHYPSHEAITAKSLACLGCMYKQCNIGVQCMKDIMPEAVLAKMKSKLGV